jgi:hypothetical protein
MIVKKTYILIITMMEINASVDSYRLDGKDKENYKSTTIAMESMMFII